MDANRAPSARMVTQLGKAQPPPPPVRACRNEISITPLNRGFTAPRSTKRARPRVPAVRKTSTYFSPLCVGNDSPRRERPVPIGQSPLPHSAETGNKRFEMPLFSMLRSADLRVQITL
ncbi:hypothetical protein RW1_035_00680 [Rhodococcus wratislaviensis NBRC 100605]|uniref:Uncharacterized protein n=1 Tax=Rhodococcus wratislaviensis NBRC 100605 TaxID=1219028 RepID=X0PUT5_RHOWR|nr:hypothetical protein RW1_035_00680 [Rhodococcus wratislaviensis NBRC 100605]